MPTVFISYSAQDRSTAATIADELRRRGVSVWFDQQEILAGDSLVGRIREGIESADYLLVLLSRSSLSSVWVEREVGIAFERFGADADTVIIPLKIDDSPVPAQFLSTRYADFAADPRKAIDEIGERITRDQGAKASLRNMVDVDDLAGDLASERQVPRGPEFYVTALLGLLTVAAAIIAAWPAFETTFSRVPKVYYDVQSDRISLPEGTDESAVLDTLKKAGIAPAGLRIRVVNKGQVVATEVKVGATVTGSFLYAKTDPAVNSKSVLMTVSLDSFQVGDKDAVVLLNDMVPDSIAVLNFGYDQPGASTTVDVVASGRRAERVTTVEAVERWTLLKALERPLLVLLLGVVLAFIVGVNIAAWRNPRLREKLLDLLDAVAPVVGSVIRILVR